MACDMVNTLRYADSKSDYHTEDHHVWDHALPPAKQPVSLMRLGPESAIHTAGCILQQSTTPKNHKPFTLAADRQQRIRTGQ